MAHNYALEPDEVAAGYVLTCQSTPIDATRSPWTTTRDGPAHPAAAWSEPAHRRFVFSGCGEGSPVSTRPGHGELIRAWRDAVGRCRPPQRPPSDPTSCCAWSRAATSRPSPQLYDPSSPRVFGLARRVLRDPAQAEEVAQEALVEVWRTAARFDRHQGLGDGWILTITHRRAVDRVRSAQAGADRERRVAAASVDTPYDDVVEEVTARSSSSRCAAAWAA